VSYWILKDGQTGTAIVTDLGGHGARMYSYSVSQKTFKGRSDTNWNDPRYRDVQPGERCPVFFSASHPWLSLLHPPEIIPPGLPLVLLILLIESGAIATIINPRSRWSRWAFPFQPGGRSPA